MDVKRKTYRPHYRDAALQRECRLPDGRIGYLQYVTKRTGRATVVVAGRRIRLPREDVIVFSTHASPDADGVLPCCCYLASDLPEHHRVTTANARVTCPGWIVHDG